jgi:hypothetical protein
MTSTNLTSESIKALALNVSPDFYLQRSNFLLTRRNSNETETTFTWSLSPSGFPGNSVLITKQVINQIAYMKIGKFTLPPSYFLPTSASQLSIKIRELNQPFALTGTKQDGFHFVLKLEEKSNVLQTEEEQTRQFRPPLNMLDQITLSFGNPVNPVEFYPMSAVATVTPGASTILTFTDEHHITATSFVYLSNFATDSTDDSEATKLANRAQGHKASPTTTTTLTLDFDSSILSGAITGPVNVTFDFHDFSIPVELGFFLNKA